MLEKVDLNKKISREDYDKELYKLQFELVKLQQKIRAQQLPVVIAYEGWDASGKGGSILRITQALDPRGVVVWPIGAPTDIEKRHHYLWRFWNRMPEAGQICVFDRTWYGRVLVERVEKLAKPDEWGRAYEEINDFERTLSDNGCVIIKFWMHISKDEQLRRFKEREDNPFKKWKICDDDWRNREKWDSYLDAAEDMFSKTDTDYAPWHIIAAEDKHYARIETAKVVLKSVEKHLKS